VGEVSIIGLGRMGSTLARCLLEHGFEVTAWNRTAAKSEGLVADGVEAAKTPADAFSASPVSLVCLTDGYAALHEFLDDTRTPAALEGRTLVQLSTGTPRDARASEERIRSFGAGYVDGAMLAFPEDIGTDACIFLVAGAGTTGSERIVRTLAPAMVDLGDEVGAPAALDLAIISMMLGAMLGTGHALAIARAEGVLDRFAEISPDLAALIPDDVAYAVGLVASAAYADPRASVETWLAVAERLRQHSADAELDDAFPRLANSLYARALAMGHGELDPAVVTEILSGRGLGRSDERG